MSATQFLQQCKLTCFGGSECGTCACTKPSDCKMQQHPEFDTKRREARERMERIIK